MSRNLSESEGYYPLVDWLDVMWVVAIVGLGVGIALAAFSRDSFHRAFGVVLPILAMLVILDLIAISTDFHDADGVFDCWSYCSPWQQVVGWTLWVGALLVLLLVIAVGLRETFRSLRSR